MDGVDRRLDPGPRTTCEPDAIVNDDRLVDQDPALPGKQDSGLAADLDRLVHLEGCQAGVARDRARWPRSGPERPRGIERDRPPSG